ncbi:leucine dehydrogenase [Aliiruegeria haliotis]|uniref:Leucine dehydrogenase n=1 Tax=Aliiruegeria haliotis TaxID=1280846 RepID=A0A2T0RZ29_9RHOB|nr:Glu/Leu/Phe/Val dehydrogenase dimerization domain-containing protein [Aliiruegeria haliotis]PRY26428.1 leucine dehydrogenase [Aliiruegeria haliotis]
MHIEEIATQTHERVLFCTDEGSGLRSIVAVHDTTLGPALGGCRMWAYDSIQEAVSDALRLSAGMTAKAALAGVPFGGGKAVILGDPRHDKTPEKLRAFGRFIDTLKGAYTTGEDVGMTPADMAIVAQETAHVSGLDSGEFASGDPSPVTAEGVFRCMKLAAAQAFGSGDLAGRTVAIQGLGHVGMSLAERVHTAGGSVVAADVNRAATEQAAQALGATILPPQALLEAEADILAPCALGGVLSRETIPTLRARIVCGAANNQLAEPRCAEALQDRGILYCPDFVVNAGGLISVAREALRIRPDDWVETHLRAAVAGFQELLQCAEEQHCPPLKVANDKVAEILATARHSAFDQSGRANEV